MNGVQIMRKCTKLQTADLCSIASTLLLFQTMEKIIFSLFLIVLASAQADRIVGGYTPYKDLSSPQFQAVRKYIFDQHPSVAHYDVADVGRQLVNGFNYMVVLKPKGYNCSATAIVYASFQLGPKRISDFNNTCTTGVAPPTYTDNTVIPPTIGGIAGGFTVVTNPSGQQYNDTLAQALAQNPQYSANDLIKVQTQVVSGINYRFTFKNKDNTTSQVTIYVPLTSNQSPTPTFVGGTNPTVVGETTPTVGGYTVVTDKSAYSEALKAITDKYPSISNYQIVLVQSQIVAGRNFIFNFTDKRDANCVKKADYKVFVSLQDVKTVTQLLQVNVCKYNPAQIAKGISDSAALYPQLKGSELKRVSNIWPWGQGLKLSYEGEKKRAVYIFSSNGKDYNLIFND